jgi:hypothetical protein
LHNAPGQIQQLTPPCDEQVPERFWLQLYVLSRQTAVALPHDAEIGAATVQMFDPGRGVGVGVGVGVGAGVAVTVPETSVDPALVPQEFFALTRA